MKNREIERKWLVSAENLPDISKMCYMDITQGYISGISTSKTFRLRQILYMTHRKDMIGEEFTMTIKGRGSKDRSERETPIWKPIFSTFWPECENNIVNKLRYEIPGHDNKIIYLDIYKNKFKGLYTIEVEFTNIEECDAYEPESWFGREVTEEKEYANAYMAFNGPPSLFL